jgi:hypothetical protein
MTISRPIQKILLAALLAGAAATPALAQISVQIGIAPPQPQYEAVPVLPPDRVWAPGYWAWNGDRYIWVRGHAILQRPGYRWAPDEWERRDDGYNRRPGYWVRDANPVYFKEKKFKKPKHGRDDEHGKGHGKGHND